ncbi:MAG: DUF512 domain-containing protein [Vampirovibrionales bacterium]
MVTPGINDTAVLSQSLEDLYTLWPHCLSVAIVPVGLTQHRQALPGLTAVDGACAEAVLDRLAAFAGTDPNKAQFAFCSDEFYLLANRPFPGSTPMAASRNWTTASARAGISSKPFRPGTYPAPENNPCPEPPDCNGQAGGHGIDPHRNAA